MKILFTNLFSRSFTVKFLYSAILIFYCQSVFGHSVQIGWCVQSNGDLRVYTEHWHGDQNNNTEFQNAPLVINFYFANSPTITQTISATGWVNNTTWDNICGGNLTVVDGCPGEENTYNDWLYWDFPPLDCSDLTGVEIVSGTTAITADACGTLFPELISNEINLECYSETIQSCDPVVVNYSSVHVNAPCDPNVVLTYDIPSGSTFSLGTTTVTVTATDVGNNTAQCSFDINIIPPDLDGDGFSSVNTPCGSQDDCDDNDPNTYPGAPELCDGLDNDCDGVVPGDEIDDDGDGYSECQGDCDDNNGAINPGATEILTNGIDDNCDGLVDIPPYCTFYTYYPCYYMWIENVSLEDIDNDSDCGSNGYSNFMGIQTELNPGGTYTISVSGNNAYEQYASVFIDWNLDGDFNDAGELVASYIYLHWDGSPGTGTFSVPSSATGSYVMRIISDYYYDYYYTYTDPCFSYYGEAEDYLINTCEDPDDDGVCGDDDNCPNTPNPDQADSDCDTVGDVCDICPNGDDTVDNNGDGIPDCSQALSLSDYADAWKCGNNNNKIYLCHLPPGNPANMQTLCISANAVPSHLSNHTGDSVGPCISCGSNNNTPEILTNNAVDTDDFLNVRVYPNPATDNVNLSIGGVHETTLIYIYDINGKVVWQEMMEHTHGKIGFDLSSQLFQAGVYTVHASNSYESFTEKLIIIK